MYTVKAEGTKMFYLLGSEESSDLMSLDLSVSMPEPDALRRIRQSLDVRLVVFESMLRRGRGNVYYMYWKNGKNLDDLDQRVASETYREEDFVDSVKTVFQESRCDRCGSRWRTLVIPPGDPYPGAPGLIERKIAMSKFVACPNCEASFRQMVVKVLGPVVEASGAQS